jgi:sulfhydrogenase subunit beta (sulfur reductase)
MSGSKGLREHPHHKAALNRDQLAALIVRIQSEGFTVIGPTVRSGAIDYAAIDGIEDLPTGWIERQGPGTCRLVRSGEMLAFQHTVGPTPWKRFIIPDDSVYWHARERENGFTVIPTPPPDIRLAFLGVRSCDLHGLAILDRLFLGKRLGEAPDALPRSEVTFIDPNYRRAREGLLTIAFHCGWPGDSCFCTSMGTGPKAADGFDLAFTELTIQGEVLYLAETGSERGAQLLAGVSAESASPIVLRAAEQMHERAARTMRRTFMAEGLKELLYRQLDHPRWQEAARRCLTCGNCTLVCPTCFCSTVLDATDLEAQEAVRRRRWDSCFSIDFSYLHGGGSIRMSSSSRYRHWVIHKLATWQDQFGVSGCVGCGRCITWCPAGIDITEEVNSIRESDRLMSPNPEEACHASL